MAVEKINYDDTLRQGADKINAILEQSNASSTKVDGYAVTLNQGIEDAKQIATDAGEEAVKIATQAGEQANITANEAKGIAQNANTKSDQAVSTANQNKQEFDQLRNDFDDLVAEAGDSNPEIVQARTDTQGIKQTTLANRLTIDFNTRMSKADGVEMMSGQTNVVKMMDFQGKTAGNTATNPHAYYSDFTANTLKKPSATWNEVSQSDYNKLASRDDSGISTGSTAAGIIPQQMAILDTVATAKALSPQLFDGLTNEESVQFVKDNFVSFTVSVRAKAISPNNKNVKVALHMPASNSWSKVIQEDATEFMDFTTQINDNQYIDANGKVYFAYFVDPSNGVKPASIEVDYTGIQIELTMNAQAVLEKSGFAKTEDTASKQDFDTHIADMKNPHKVTKSQVGLSDVQNYSIATEAEAKAGVSDEKYMTPAKVKTAIDSNFARVDYRFDGNGQADTSVKSSIDSSLTYIELSRIGDVVYLRGRINLTASTSSATRAKFFDIPAGYRCDFNNAVAWAKYGATNPECTALAERSGFFFMGNQTGNYYFTQSWFTTDAMPK